MKEFADSLQQQLEEATSAAPLREAHLPPETAALREGWRVLGRALEQQDQPFDEAPFTARMQRELLAMPAKGNGVLVGKRPSMLPVTWLIGGALVGGVLAASLIFVAVLAASRLSNPATVAVKQPEKAPATKETVVVKKTTPASEPGTVAVPQHPTEESDGNTSSWDDPLDSQIITAAAQMEQMQQPTYRLDTSISTLSWQLQQMAEDMDNGAL